MGVVICLPSRMHTTHISLFVILALAVTASQAQTRRGASLAEQKMCSEQAQHFQGANSMIVNHYDKARNVCFVRIWESLHDPNDRDKFIGVSYELRDAFEGFAYGMCLTDADNKILDCWAMVPANKDKKSFTSTDAWLAYVGQTYMSD